MPTLRGRRCVREEEEEVQKSESDEEFDFGTGKEVEDKYREPKLKPTKQGGGKAKKAKNPTWSNVIKGLEDEDELEELVKPRISSLPYYIALKRSLARCYLPFLV